MTQEKFSQKSLTHADIPRATYHIPKTSTHLIMEEDADAALILVVSFPSHTLQEHS